MSGALTRHYALDELAAVSTPLTAVLSLDELPRFVEGLSQKQTSDHTVMCELVPKTTSDGNVTVRGIIKTAVELTCQRCLGVIRYPLEITVNWRIDQQAVTSSDDESEESRINLLAWVEDELLLSLPQYAHHDDGKCDMTLVDKYKASEKTELEETTSPFAGLKDLISKKQDS